MQGLRLREVEAKVGLKKTKIHNLISQGLFPKPMKIGRSSIWLENEIDEALSNMASKRGFIALTNSQIK